jgi:hypothetical protein
MRRSPHICQGGGRGFESRRPLQVRGCFRGRRARAGSQSGSHSTEQGLHPCGGVPLQLAHDFLTPGQNPSIGVAHDRGRHRVRDAGCEQERGRPMPQAVERDPGERRPSAKSRHAPENIAGCQGCPMPLSMTSSDRMPATSSRLRAARSEAHRPQQSASAARVRHRPRPTIAGRALPRGVAPARVPCGRTRPTGPVHARPRGCASRASRR